MKEIERTCQNETHLLCSDFQSKLDSVQIKRCDMFAFLTGTTLSEAMKEHLLGTTPLTALTVYFSELLPVLSSVTCLVVAHNQCILRQKCTKTIDAELHEVPTLQIKQFRSKGSTGRNGLKMIEVPPCREVCVEKVVPLHFQK